MKSGVSFPSYARSASWTVSAGIADPAYPVTNLANLEEVRRVFLASSAGTRNLHFTLPSAQLIDFVALIHHNAAPANTFRLQLFSDAGFTTQIYDSGPTAFWPFGGSTGAGYPVVRPIVLTAAYLAQSGRILLNEHATAWEIGAVEIGRFWQWEVEFDRAMGFEGRSTSSESGGLEHVTRQWSPRVVSGSRELVAQSEVDNTFLDFQRTNGLNRAFVWTWDADDPATWDRQSLIVTNAELPPGRVVDYNAGRMAFAFREHLR